MFEGVFTAMITPFKNGKIDFDALEKFIEFQIKNGVSGLVPAGTTGEAATMSNKETEELFKFVVKKVNKRVKIIGGTGTNSTEKVIEKTKIALDSGCDGALIVSPYYNKPTQKGLIQHYTKIAKEVNIPIVLYNVPGRTSGNIEANTVIELSKISNIVAVKEASGNLTQITKIIRDTDDSFTLLSGEDFINLPILSVGGNGFISVTSNIAPNLLVELYNSFKGKDRKKTQNLHAKLIGLTEAMFCETNPIPVKAAVNLLGYCEKEIRLPLVWISDNGLSKVKEELKKLEII
jgi:4-hydroxy-tetrahydrodipicolinate synthase